MIETQSTLQDIILAVFLWLLIGAILLWIFPGKCRIDEHLRKDSKHVHGNEYIPFYYKLLCVDKNSSLDEIRSSYQNLVKIYHPDVSADKDTERKFREIRIAYETLSDPEKRAHYDKFEENFK